MNFLGRIIARIIFGILSIIFGTIERILERIFKRIFMALERIAVPVVIVATLILWAMVGISHL